MSVDYRILGPIEVVGDDGTALALGGARQRRLLAVLLQGDSHWVGTERIIDAVWAEEEPPAGGAKTVATYVSRLRSVLGEGLGRHAGRRLPALPQRLPARCRSIRAARRPGPARTGQGRPRPPRRRPRPLAGPGVRRVRRGALVPGRRRPALEELRLAAHELRAQARLDVGDTAIAIAELERAAAGAPGPGALHRPADDGAPPRRPPERGPAGLPGLPTRPRRGGRARTVGRVGRPRAAHRRRRPVAAAGR